MAGIIPKIIVVAAFFLIIPGVALLWRSSNQRDKALNPPDLNPSTITAYTVANDWWVLSNSNLRAMGDYDVWGILLAWVAAACAVFGAAKYPGAGSAGRVLFCALFFYFLHDNSMTSWGYANLWRRIRDSLFVNASPEVTVPDELKQLLGGIGLCYIGMFLCLVSLFRLHLGSEYRVLRILGWVVSLAFIVIGSLALWAGRSCEFGSYTNSQPIDTLNMSAGAVAIFLFLTLGVFGSMGEMAVVCMALVGWFGIFILTELFFLLNGVDTSFSGYSDEDLKQVRAGYGFDWLCMISTIVTSFFVWASTGDGNEGGTYA